MLFFKGKIYAYSFKFKFKTSSIFSIRLSKISHYLRPSDNKLKPLPSAVIDALLKDKIYAYSFKFKFKTFFICSIRLSKISHYLHSSNNKFKFKNSSICSIKSSKAIIDSNQTFSFSSSLRECGEPKQGFTKKQKEDRKRSSFPVTLIFQVSLVPVWWRYSLEKPASRCSDSLGLLSRSFHRPATLLRSSVASVPHWGWRNTEVQQGPETI